MSIEFSPDTWDRSADAIRDECDLFASKAESLLAGMTTASLGCDGNGTMMDMAFSVIFPPSIDAFKQASAGLARGLTNAGDAMTSVAASYRATEAENESISQQVGT